MNPNSLLNKILAIRANMDAAENQKYITDGKVNAVLALDNAPEDLGWIAYHSMKYNGQFFQVYVDATFNVSNADLSNVDFTYNNVHLVLKDCLFSGVNLTNTVWDGTIFSGRNQFKNSLLTNALMNSLGTIEVENTDLSNTQIATYNAPKEITLQAIRAINFYIGYEIPTFNMTLNGLNLLAQNVEWSNIVVNGHVVAANLNKASLNNVTFTAPVIASSFDESKQENVSYEQGIFDSSMQNSSLNIRVGSDKPFPATIYLDAQPGNYVVQPSGKSLWNSNVSESIKLLSSGYNQMRFSQLLYGIIFQVPKHFEAEKYEARRFPFSNPGIDISGDGRGCNNIDGSFEIAALEYLTCDTLGMLALRFEQRCERNNSPLNGLILNKASDLVVGSNFAGSNITNFAANNVIANNFYGAFFANAVPERYQGLIVGSWQCPEALAPTMPAPTPAATPVDPTQMILMGLGAGLASLIPLFLIYKLFTMLMPTQSDACAKDAKLNQELDAVVNFGMSRV